ncbi:MAG: RNA polymerase sigma-70 factor (ECF subfamily) [Chlamydiales bacterium]|jgi:RNA polymerase sigma-70 factor (ECF subfamily)
MGEHDTEQSSLEQLQAGDPAAFEALVRERGPRLRSVARRLLGNDVDTDEVLQEAFLAAFRGIGKFKGSSGLGTWLHRIVINTALMRLRSRTTSEEELPADLMPAFLEGGAFRNAQAAWQGGPHRDAVRAETGCVVRGCIDQLPDTARTAVVLRDLEGLSNEELGQQLGISANAAKIRVHRGRQALRSLLERAFEGYVG